jgi:predicted component of type VI protein secretion system
MHMQTRLLLAFLSLALIAGCSSSTDPSDPGTTRTPTVGTRYVTYEEERDAFNNVQGQDTSFATVAAVNLDFDGRAGVVRIVESDQSNPSKQDTAYYQLKSNGDIALFFPLIEDHDGNPIWLNLPTSGSGGGTTVLSEETTVEGGITYLDKLVLKTTNEGTESITLTNGQAHTANKFHVLLQVTRSLGGQQVQAITFVDTRTWWSEQLQTP